MRKKLTYNYVKKVFKDAGCELLSDEYINSRIKLEYRCSCGNVSEILWYNFKKGNRCNKCGISKRANKKRLSIEYVKQYFEDNGCVLLSKTYKHNLQKLDYVCQCGNMSKIRFNSFQKGSRCKKCGTDKRIDVKKHSFEYVDKYFKDNECTLLSKNYIHTLKMLDYICVCGNKSKISFNSFKQGSRCRKCGIAHSVEKNSGRNHWNYNFNLTDEERSIKRTHIEHKKWRKQIYAKYNYICQKCLQRGGKLNAHHIQNYSSNKDLRLDVSNGILFCTDCHVNFHKIYGKIRNSQTQLDEFLKVSSLCLK